MLQVGKSQEQCMRFLKHLPREVTVLPYPLTSPAEHSRVLHDVVFHQMPDAQGIWVIDHDTLFRENIEPWLCAADTRLAGTKRCLAVPGRRSVIGGITSPFFWISPSRWPQAIDNFDPVPFAVSQQSRRPDRESAPAGQRMPDADTLVRAKESLEREDRVEVFSLRDRREPRDALPSPPRFRHCGGLSLLSSPSTAHARDTPWVRRTVRRLSTFYRDCPPQWIAIEDPVLLHRLWDCQTLWQKTAHCTVQRILRAKNRLRNEEDAVR